MLHPPLAAVGLLCHEGDRVLNLHSPPDSTNTCAKPSRQAVVTYKKARFGEDMNTHKRAGLQGHMGRVGLLLASLVLAACGNDSTTTSGSTNPNGNSGGVITQPSQVEPLNRFNLANSCFAIQSVASGQFVSKNTDGTYSVASSTAGNAEPFYMKPTALGKYMVYTTDAFLMRGAGTAINSAQAFADDIEWTVTEQTGSAETFRLTNTATKNNLALNPEAKTLVQAAASDSAPPQQFKFVRRQGCTPFPEIASNAIGATFTTPEGAPVKGFADVHNHITATTFLGGAHHGRPHHRFGVTEALGSCEANHGPDGRLDLVDNLFKGTPQATHDVVGWPTFNDWPAAQALTHEGLYYKWLERAWKSGLRIFVTNLVENETLCSLVIQTKGNPTVTFPQLGMRDSPCNEMESAVKQIDYIRDLEQYVDAQEGGPGKGWFRIVTSPEEARKVISQGKLAVVLGIEISHLFNCNLTRAGAGCDKAEIDAQLKRIYDLGVRQMFPIHEFDNAFGGNGIFDGAILNVGNFADTGSFWSTYDCPGGENNYKDFIRTPGAVMTSLPGLGNDPLTAALIANNPGIAPLYPTEENRRQCNKRGLTELGKYAFTKLMEKGVIIEVDHLELSIKGDLIDMAERQLPAYPLVSTHGAHGGITKEQGRRIVASGGIVYPYHGNAQSWNNDFKTLSTLKSSNHKFAMGFGADTNGLGAQAGPRGADRPQIKYPFTLFSGPEWAGVFDSPIAPLVFEQQKSGERIFNANSEGQAHYGLKADWVEELKLEGGKDALKALYDSAEVYIQMWEKTTAKRAAIKP